MMAGITASGIAGGGSGGGDPHWANVVLLCGFEGPDASTSFVDESSFARTLTAVGDAQIDTAQYAIGESSLLCDGSGDYLSTPDSSDLEFGSDPFTVECFVRFDSVSSVQGIVSKLSNSTGGPIWAMRYNSGSNAFGFTYGSTASGGTFTDVGVTMTPTIGRWYFLAADFDGSRLRFYLDGVKSNHTDAFTGMPNSNGGMRIGSYVLSLSNRNLDGWVDEVRITKGVARYATDGSFTVPSEAFPRS